MPNWVRVKDPATGHEFTATAEQADAAGVRPLSKEAASPFGAPLEPKYHTTVDEAAAAKNKGA